MCTILLQMHFILFFEKAYITNALNDILSCELMNTLYFPVQHILMRKIIVDINN